MREIRIGKRTISRDFLFFLIATALLGVTMAIENTSIANRLHEDLGFEIQQRTMLEVPRELPGLLVVFLVGGLAFLGDVKTAAVANIFGGIGLFLFGLVPSGFLPVMATLMIYNTGTHIYMPMQGTISMSFAKDGNIGRRLGQVQSVSMAALILTSGSLILLYRFLEIPFVVSFTVGAIAMILAGVMFFFIGPLQAAPRRKRFVFKKKYKLFYMLCIIFGMRKQITITFVPWLIVRVYDQPVVTITILFFIVSVINIFFRPWLGGFIDRKGERFVLMMEAFLIIVSCLGFAFSRYLFPESVALIVVACCYIIDNLFSGAGMARTTYVKRLSDDPGEVSATLALGISLDHVLSMSVPTVAGILWATNMGQGYVYVFCAGLVIAVLNLLISNRIRVPIANAS
ncbi:MAG: MFS transporter [Oscillospiraceae bacterium]|nr:MFS transporter [Oscillospiraceae bacterium]